MTFGRRTSRAYACFCAALALSGTGAYLSIGFLPLAIIAQVPAPAQKPRSVEINILVVEGHAKEGKFDPRLEKLKDSLPGVVGARILDELKTTAEEGSSVSLEIMRQSGEARLLKVTVKKIDPKGTVRLKVAIDALKFSADTVHENGGIFIVRHPLSEEKALFLLVTPKL